ncbi:MAG: hypothetical protein AB1429_11165 [Pseudomonadota bacterium]|jgi:hypothetical protein
MASFDPFSLSSTDQIQATAAIVGAVMSAATAGIALLVFVEARSIRKIEWFSKSLDNWQAFNRLLIDADYADRWALIADGAVDWEDITRNDMSFIYSFLNILIFEFNAQRRGVLERWYATDSIFANILYFKHIWPELYAHLRRDGWPKLFLKHADAAIRRDGAN